MTSRLDDGRDVGPDGPVGLTGLTSKATAAVLAALLPGLRAAGVADLTLTATGGVDAARAVRAGDESDLVFLDVATLTELADEGRLDRATIRGLFVSTMVAAVPAGVAPPPLVTEQDVRSALAAARAIGYSTGPSGTALLALLERWGIREALSDKLVQAPPGVPVGSLLTSGQADLGFQQYSELMTIDGLQIINGLPADVGVTTTFGGAVGVASTHADVARAVLGRLGSPDVADIVRSHGMATAV